MGIDDDGQILRVLAVRQRHVAVDRQAVARLVRDRLHPGHPGFRQPWRDIAELGELVRARIEEIARPRRAVAVRGDDEPVLVVCHALDSELVSGKLLLQRREQFLGLGVEIFPLWLPGDVAYRREYLALVRIREAADIDCGMLEQHSLLFGSRRISI